MSMILWTFTKIWWLSLLASRTSWFLWNNNLSIHLFFIWIKSWTKYHNFIFWLIISVWLGDFMNRHVPGEGAYVVPVFLNSSWNTLGSRFKETTGSTSESYFLVLREFLTYCTVSAIDHCNLQPQFWNSSE